MTLSKQSLEILMDLIEIKVCALQVQDRDDARELNKLRKCRQELLLEKNLLSSTPQESPMESAPCTEKRYRRSYTGS